MNEGLQSNEGWLTISTMFAKCISKIGALKEIIDVSATS